MSNKRYFFNVIGEAVEFHDVEGVVLPGPELAKRQAAVLAAELAEDDYEGFIVCVLDQTGKQVARVPVVAAIGHS